MCTTLQNTLAALRNYSSIYSAPYIAELEITIALVPPANKNKCVNLLAGKSKLKRTLDKQVRQHMSLQTKAV